MARRTMNYSAETYCIEADNDGQIVEIGSKDTYWFEPFNANPDYAILYIFRFADGRNIEEKHFYELKVTALAKCSETKNIDMQSDDIILGIYQWNGCYTPLLFVLRPYYKRGATGNLTSMTPCW